MATMVVLSILPIMQGIFLILLTSYYSQIIPGIISSGLTVGKLLRCAKSVEISSDDFGDSCHGQPSEPFFYNSNDTVVKHTTIAVDRNGRCVIAEEIGKRDPNTNRPKWWKCTAECNHVISKDVKTIMSI